MTHPASESRPIPVPSIPFPARLHESGIHGLHGRRPPRLILTSSFAARPFRPSAGGQDLPALRAAPPSGGIPIPRVKNSLFPDGRPFIYARNLPDYRAARLRLAVAEIYFNLPAVKARQFLPGSLISVPCNSPPAPAPRVVPSRSFAPQPVPGRRPLSSDAFSAFFRREERPSAYRFPPLPAPPPCLASRGRRHLTSPW